MDKMDTKFYQFIANWENEKKLIEHVDGEYGNNDNIIIKAEFRKLLDLEFANESNGWNGLSKSDKNDLVNRWWFQIDTNRSEGKIYNSDCENLNAASETEIKKFYQTVEMHQNFLNDFKLIREKFDDFITVNDKGFDNHKYHKAAKDELINRLTEEYLNACKKNNSTTPGEDFNLMTICKKIAPGIISEYYGYYLKDIQENLPSDYNIHQDEDLNRILDQVLKEINDNTANAVETANTEETVGPYVENLQEVFDAYINIAKPEINKDQTSNNQTDYYNILRNYGISENYITVLQRAVLMDKLKEVPDYLEYVLSTEDTTFYEYSSKHTLNLDGNKAQATRSSTELLETQPVLPGLDDGDVSGEIYNKEVDHTDLGVIRDHDESVNTGGTDGGNGNTNGGKPVIPVDDDYNTYDNKTSIYVIIKELYDSLDIDQNLLTKYNDDFEEMLTEFINRQLEDDNATFQTVYNSIEYFYKKSDEFKNLLEEIAIKERYYNINEYAPDFLKYKLQDFDDEGFIKSICDYGIYNEEYRKIIDYVAEKVADHHEYFDTIGEVEDYIVFELTALYNEYLLSDLSNLEEDEIYDKYLTAHNNAQAIGQVDHNRGLELHQEAAIAFCKAMIDKGHGTDITKYFGSDYESAIKNTKNVANIVQAVENVMKAINNSTENTAPSLDAEETKKDDQAQSSYDLKETGACYCDQTLEFILNNPKNINNVMISEWDFNWSDSDQDLDNVKENAITNINEEIDEIFGLLDLDEKYKEKANNLVKKYYAAAINSLSDPYDDNLNHNSEEFNTTFWVDGVKYTEAYTYFSSEYEYECDPRTCTGNTAGTGLRLEESHHYYNSFCMAVNKYALISNIQRFIDKAIEEINEKNSEE